MGIFSSKKEQSKVQGAVKDFEYLDTAALYFDAACQTLRPQQVIDAEMQYYKEFNACGGRVKYRWGEIVDQKITGTREKFLQLINFSKKEYSVAFTLNTTYGINLVLAQIPAGKYEKVVTSEIEHNSVFLPTIALSKRLGIPRKILARAADGSLSYSAEDLKNAVVILNTTSNIDGRSLRNISQLAKDVHASGGILLLDAAQSIAHDLELIKGVNCDALFTSGHKMYGPSIGIIAIKKTLLDSLEINFTGGGTVSDVGEDSYSHLVGEEAYARLELGLQNFAGIVALGAAIDWLQSYKPNGQSQKEHQEKLSKMLHEGLKSIPSVHLLNDQPTAVISFYSDKIDAHKLAMYLSAQQIMARSGYFCCHYYLHTKEKLPPFLRFSIGLYNTEEQIKKVIDITKQLIENT